MPRRVPPWPFIATIAGLLTFSDGDAASAAGPDGRQRGTFKLRRRQTVVGMIGDAGPQGVRITKAVLLARFKATKAFAVGAIIRVRSLPAEFANEDPIDKVFIDHLAHRLYAGTAELGTGLRALSQPFGSVGSAVVQHEVAVRELGAADARLAELERATRRLALVRSRGASAMAERLSVLDVHKAIRVIPSIDPTNIADVSLAWALLAGAARADPHDMPLLLAAAEAARHRQNLLGLLVHSVPKVVELLKAHRAKIERYLAE